VLAYRQPCLSFGVGHDSYGLEGPRKRNGNAMRIETTIFAFCLAALVASPATAQKLTDWRMSEVCPSAAGFAHCAEFGSRARRIVSALWATLPPRARWTCLRELRREGVKSYRTLQLCLKEEAFRPHGGAAQNAGESA